MGLRTQLVHVDQVAEFRVNVVIVADVVAVVDLQGPFDLRQSDDIGARLSGIVELPNEAGRSPMPSSFLSATLHR